MTQAHVHFGQRSVNGGISFFLCTNLRATGRTGTQACPAGPAEIPGVITADQVSVRSDWHRPVRAFEAGAFAEIVSGTFEMASPTRTSTRPSGRAAKSAVSCIKSGRIGCWPAPRKGAGRGLPYNFDQKLSPPS